MSALKNYEIVTCRYTNDAHDTIEVLYKADKPNELNSYYLPAIQPDNEDLKYLITNGWDFERIDRSTSEYNRNQKILYRQFHRYLAREEIAKVTAEMEKRIESLKQEEIQKSNILSALINNNANEEAIFRAKLAIFELPAIKDSKDRNLKMNIRKAKTLVELITTIKDFI